MLLFSIFSCKDEVLPKPASYLRLDYPEAEYANFENSASPFAFEMNSEAVIKGENRIVVYNYLSKNESYHLFDLQTGE